MAFQQPFFEVFPVARELLSKTKRIASKQSPSMDVVTPRPTSSGKLRKPPQAVKDGNSEHDLRKVSKSIRMFVEEPESMDSVTTPTEPTKNAGAGVTRHRPRVFSIFRRNTSNTAVSELVSTLLYLE